METVLLADFISEMTAPTDISDVVSNCSIMVAVFAKKYCLRKSKFLIEKANCMISSKPEVSHMKEMNFDLVKCVVHVSIERNTLLFSINNFHEKGFSHCPLLSMQGLVCIARAFIH